MKYKVTFGEAPFEVFSSDHTIVVATNELEAMKCAIRQCNRESYSYELLSEDGGNVFSGNHFLVRVCDDRGVICVVPSTAERFQAIVFPA